MTITADLLERYAKIASGIIVAVAVCVCILLIVRA